MVVVPFYLELASDEQWRQVEKTLRDMKVCFIVQDKIEGMTLEDVDKRLNGNSYQTEFQRSRQPQ